MQRTHKMQRLWWMVPLGFVVMALITALIIRVVTSQNPQTAFLTGCAIISQKNGDILGFIKQNPNITNYQDCRSGNTLLMLAAQRGNTGAVRTLLQYGADPNRRNCDQLVALHFAAYSGHDAITSVLCNCRNQDMDIVNAQNDRGATPLDAAEAGNHPKTAAIIKEHGGFSNSIFIQTADISQ